VIGRFGKVPLVTTVAPCVPAVCIDQHAPFAPNGGCYPSPGIGLDVFHGLLRDDIARGLNGTVSLTTLRSVSAVSSRGIQC
jgi:hypothetical protein